MLNFVARGTEFLASVERTSFPLLYTGVVKVMCRCPILDRTNYSTDLLIIYKDVATAHVKVPFLYMCEGIKERKLKTLLKIHGLPAEIRTEN